MGRVWEVVSDGEWRTLREIATEANVPGRAVAPALERLRLKENGGYTILRRTWSQSVPQYRLLRPSANGQMNLF